MPVTADQLLVAARSAVRATPPQLLDVLKDRHGFETDDLIQEGAMAAWKAMHTAYDPAVSQPSTFLTMRARFHMRHLARTGGLVKTPRGVVILPCRQFLQQLDMNGNRLLIESDQIEAPAEPAGAADLWDEARPLRRDWHPLMRLWVYLLFVEGMTQKEIGALWGVNKSSVCERMRDAGIRFHKTRAKKAA